MGRSMDWTLKDNVVDGLFCATLTGRRGGHTPFVQAGAEKSDTRAEAVSRTQALLGRVIPGGWVRCLGWKCGVLWGCPSTPHSIGDLPTALHVCCCCQINWWDVVRRVQMDVSIWGAVRLHSMDGWALSGADVQAPWHCARDSVALLRRSSSGWMSAKIGRLSTGVGRRHPVTIRKASLMAGSMKWVWAMRHQTGAQYSAVECSRGRVAIRRILAPAPQPQPASSGDATCDVSFLRSDSRYRRFVSDLSNVTPRYLGSEQKGRVSLLCLTSCSRLASLLLRCKAAITFFIVLSFSFQVWRYSPTVAMFLVSTPPTAWQSPSSMIARSSGGGWAFSF